MWTKGTCPPRVYPESTSPLDHAIGTTQMAQVHFLSPHELLLSVHSSGAGHCPAWPSLGPGAGKGAAEGAAGCVNKAWMYGL